MPNCRACGKVCSDWHELALHIATSKKGHWAGKKWAAKILMVNTLSPETRREKREAPVGPRPDWSQAVYQLSGNEKRVKTICPKCKRLNEQVLPVEFAESPVAWRAGKAMVIFCRLCGRREHAQE
ncbi:MAG: hypothetical protein PHQ43_15495 [Dehalococcoidales bacterium]|nr:hypothetical protein [Dehalococcoidales bacterium]